jgi:pimeloyl-ACP methyl ester carboxylesterase
MEFLARAGFDVFAMDMTGYGRSTRPTAMNDPCNLASEQQLVLAPGHSEACTPSYGQEMTTIASDWNDIGAVVDHLLALRHVSQVSLVAWSLGGPRAGGYAAQHPEKVQKLVLLAPGYNERNAADKPPA